MPSPSLPPGFDFTQYVYDSAGINCSAEDDAVFHDVLSRGWNLTHQRLSSPRVTGRIQRLGGVFDPDKFCHRCAPTGIVRMSRQNEWETGPTFPPTVRMAHYLETLSGRSYRLKGWLISAVERCGDTLVVSLSRQDQTFHLRLVPAHQAGPSWGSTANFALVLDSNPRWEHKNFAIFFLELVRRIEGRTPEHSSPA